MVCDDNDQSSSDASAVLETSAVDQENANVPRPLGTGVGYASPTNIAPEIPAPKNKFKKNPPVSDAEVAKTANGSSESIGNADAAGAAASSTTDSPTTVAVDTTARNTVSTTPNVS